MQVARFIVTPTHSNPISATPNTPLPERLNLTPSNRGNVSIFPEDKPHGSFFVAKMPLQKTFQYQTKSDFCKNILAIQNRSCDHIVSQNQFDVKVLKQILSDTEGRNQNIIYYRWSGPDEVLMHVSVVYIDKAEQKIYLLPDDSLDLSDSKNIGELLEKFKDLQKEGYSVCLPIGSFFKSSGAPSTDAQTLQRDSFSCSFLSSQFAQKLDHMNSSFGYSKIKSVDDSRSFMHEIRIEEQGKKLIWKPFYDGDPQLESYKNSLFLNFKTFILPNEFYGTSQRMAPIVLNEFLFNQIFPEQKNSVYNRGHEKQSSRKLWTDYFNFPFEENFAQTKYEKTIDRLKTTSGIENVYGNKTSHIRKAYNLNLISPENLEASVQIAKDVYAIFKLPPTQAFFEKLGVQPNSAEHRDILGRISSDLFIEIPAIPEKEIEFVAKSSVDITYNQVDSAPTPAQDDDEDIPDMDDFDATDNVVTQ